MIRHLPQQNWFLAIVPLLLQLASSTTGLLQANDEFLKNGVTAHRGNSASHPENTLAAFQSAIEVGADWIELDVFRTQDGSLVVIHDRTTGRVGDRDLAVAATDYAVLREVDVASDFRARYQKSLEQCPPQRIPLLREVLELVVMQNRTRVSIQPKMDCVAEILQLIEQANAAEWVAFNDSSLEFMTHVKRAAPQIRVFWDRGKEADIDSDLVVAKKLGFEALVLHKDSVTPEKVGKIREAGLQCGAWTVNQPDEMTRLLQLGVQRLYTDHPGQLLRLKRDLEFPLVQCEGKYSHHLQGVCRGLEAIYWSFTTRLVKTDRNGGVLKQITVDNHHGDLCLQNGKLFVAVNLGEFNHPDGKADSWIYVYDPETLEELNRYPVPEVLYGAGGIGVRRDRFYVVGGLPSGFNENYIYEYDQEFRFVRRHVLASGYTRLGIQTATFASGKWWFGCYGSPSILLVADPSFASVQRFEFDSSLGIESGGEGWLWSASGNCPPDAGCSGQLQIVFPDERLGLRRWSEAKNP